MVQNAPSAHKTTLTVNRALYSFIFLLIASINNNLLFVFFVLISALLDCQIYLYLHLRSSQIIYIHKR